MVAGIVSLQEVPEGRLRQVRVYLDSGESMILALETVVEAGLHPGLVLTDSDIQNLHAQDMRQRCHDAALIYLSYRPRSEQEIRTHLAQKKFPVDVVEATVTRLKETGLVDDAAFARFWVENREAFRPRSGRALRAELARKGVSSEIIATVLPTDDAEAAYRAAQARGRRLVGLDYVTFRRRLIPYLQRRGFTYEVANSAALRLWRELQDPSASEGPARE